MTFSAPPTLDPNLPRPCQSLDFAPRINFVLHIEMAQLKGTVPRYICLSQGRSAISGKAVRICNKMTTWIDKSPPIM